MDLNNCKRCGGEADLFRPNGTFAVECHGCGASIQSVSTMQKAVDRWNETNPKARKAKE